MFMKRILSILFFSVFLFFGNAYAQNSVVASPGTLQDKYAKRSGSLRFSTTTLNLGKLANNQIRKDTIRIFNIASRPVTISVSGKIPPHIQVSPGQNSIDPGTEGWIAISYDAGLKNDFGFVLDRIAFSTNDSIQAVKYINITATLFENFPVMTAEDSAMVQKARVPELTFNYGTISQGEKKFHEFVVYNDGKRDLTLHKAKSNCGCIQTTLSKNVIAAGDSAIVRVDFDSFGKEGKDSRKVNVYMNDPAMPEIKLEMVGEILK